MEKIDILMDIIRTRRSVFPPLYASDKEVPRSIIEKILEAANWAPSHKKTEPWRGGYQACLLNNNGPRKPHTAAVSRNQRAKPF